MSVIVFPFRTEDPEIVLNNLRIAASHPAVDLVLAVGAETESTFQAVGAARQEIEATASTAVELILQDRIGTKRAGKGDGMNTGLRYFLSQTTADRIHFYDADITSFGPEWITQAERGADLGYDVVRHFFPRASTDAMITWMVTRTGFALLWPGSELPRIEQPLGGELLFTRPVAAALVADVRVQEQSDWGIDTLYTFSTIQAGFSVYETYVRQGKAHALYGGLTDLRVMLVECFTAMQNLSGEKLDDAVAHRVEATDAVPASVTEKIGYNLEATLHLLGMDWTDHQADLLEYFPDVVRAGMLANRSAPTFLFMDEDAWYQTYRTLVEHFVSGDEDWESLLFRLWIARVINYTATRALRGYDHSQRYLEAMVARYVRRVAFGS